MGKEGFIFLHRKLIDWEWYSNINVTRVFIHCLLEANHEDNKWQGQIIKKGSFITSYEKLAIATSLTTQQVRTALNKLKLTGEITYKSTSRNSIITINNWSMYQANNKQNNKQITNKQQTNNKQITTNNNDNNDNNEKKYISLYEKNEKNFSPETKPKKLDPYINPIAEYYKKTYKEIMGNTCYLNNEHRNKIVELAADIENFKDTIPEVLEKLKNLKFDDLPQFKPSNTWLLKNDNYIRMLEGVYEKEHVKTTEEILDEIMEQRRKEGKRTDF